MAYKVPSLEEMLQFSVAHFKAMLPDRNVGSRFSFNWKLLKTITGGATDVHAHVDTGLKDVMPDTARGGALDRWIFIFAPGGKKLRKAATPARKAAAGRVRGSVAATTAVGDRLIHRPTSLLFQINSNGTIPATAGAAFVDVDIVAVDTGSLTRLKKGEVLEYTSAPAGIQTKVELQKDLSDDGFDGEQDGDAHNRLLAALATPSSGGNQSDFVGWILAQLGISGAFTYPNRAGVGTIDVVGLHTGVGTARILNNAEAAALLAALQALAPAQLAANGGALRVLTVIGGSVDAANLANVELTVVPDGSPQYAFDWDDTTPPVVLSWTLATRTLQFTGGTRPITLQAGHRICLRGVASSQDGAPLVVEALSGADSVILQTAPANNPAAGDVVYAGGPLTDVVRGAILAHLNGDVLYAAPTGPLPGAAAVASSTSVAQLHVLATGIGTANPGGIYGPWIGTLLIGTLATIATYTRGVRKHTVITPAADQEAVDYAFPLDNQIGLLTPGYVLVRKGS